MALTSLTGDVVGDEDDDDEDVDVVGLRPLRRWW